MSKNSEKYDRQIRLWGPDGQKEIESAVICALGSNEINSEILKNMCLHAIGHIVIVDDAKVTEADVGINFLVEEDCIGQNRADVVAKLLNEINPDPEIQTIIKSPTDLTVLDDPMFTSKTFVISNGNYSPDFIEKLSDKVRSKGMRQLHAQSTGFYGAFYLDAGSHYALEGGNDAEAPNDFRLDKPFQALKEYLESFDITKMTDSEIEKIPFIVPLYWARQQYLKKTGEKTIEFGKRGELRKILFEFDNGRDLEVIEETMGDNTAYGCERLSLPPNMQKCFDICDEFPEDDIFCRVVRAARDMYKEQGVPPHYGGLPDINCSSEEYQRIKRIYREKGEEDTNYLISKLPDIDPEFIRQYVKNSWRSIGMKYKPIKELISIPNKGFVYDENTKSAQHTQSVFIASRLFVQKNNRVPSIGDEKEMVQLSKENGAEDPGIEKVVEEFCRFKGTILPSVTATLSAIAAQEITKVIIKKATPINGILVYDAIGGFVNTSF
jgi:amyloid beta precursor protein binding protein 1